MSEALQAVLREPVGPWQRREAPAGDVAVSSRVRLARNVAGLPFPPRMRPEDVKRLFAAITEAVAGVGADLGPFVLQQLADLAPLERQVLVEKHLISPQHAQQGDGAILVRADEQLSAMVLEEDHLRLQALCPGLQPEAAWQLAQRLDDALEAHCTWAYSESLGYLTTCPTNLGTGMRASVMLHLPALGWTGRIASLISELGKVGVVARGLYGEGSKAGGNLLQVSNQASLGKTEAEVVSLLDAVARQIVSRERSAREALLAERRHHLEDRVWRAYGLLSNARLLTSDEALQLLSDLKLGCDLRILPPLVGDRWAELVVLSRSGFLQHKGGEASAARRDVRRADRLRQALVAALVPQPVPKEDAAPEARDRQSTGGASSDGEGE